MSDITFIPSNLAACLLRKMMDCQPVDDYANRLDGGYTKLAGAILAAPPNPTLRVAAFEAALPGLQDAAAIRAAVFAADPGADLELLTQAEQEKNQFSTWADIDGLLGPIAWAWQSWLPMGLLTILAGESGAGKSALALRLAACFLRGDPWPDKSEFTGNQGSVLWCETEAAQAVNLERAKKWGLPLEKIITPGKPLDDLRLDTTAHQAELAGATLLPGVQLIIIDSLRGATGRDENSSDILGLIGWLAALARDCRKPVLLIHHLRKRSVFDTDSVELERLRGSSAIVQAARLVWALDVPDPNSKDWKRLHVIKSNLARFPGPIGMTIDDSGVRFGLSPEKPRIETVADKAADLLLSLLQREPLKAEVIQQEFNQAGISQPSMKRAKERLGIISTKKKDGWYWSLPPKGTYDQ